MTTYNPNTPTRERIAVELAVARQHDKDVERYIKERVEALDKDHCKR